MFQKQPGIYWVHSLLWRLLPESGGRGPQGCLAPPPSPSTDIALVGPFPRTGTVNRRSTSLGFPGSDVPQDMVSCLWLRVEVCSVCSGRKQTLPLVCPLPLLHGDPPKGGAGAITVFWGSKQQSSWGQLCSALHKTLLYYYCRHCYCFGLQSSEKETRE